MTAIAIILVLAVLLLPALFIMALGSGDIILDRGSFILFAFLFLCFALAADWLNQKLKGNHRGTAIVIVLCIAAFLTGVATREPAEDASADADEEISRAEKDSLPNAAKDDNSNAKSELEDLPSPSPNSKKSGGGLVINPIYEDERWRTTVPELVAIPEDQRWYNARSHMGTTCTIVGPVIDVYQAVDEAGAPVFVNIGEAYPSSGNVTLVVWAQDIDPFLDMLNDVNDGDAWLSVTGYLNNYEGMPQFNTAMSDIHCRWWTNVS